MLSLAKPKKKSLPDFKTFYVYFICTPVHVYVYKCQSFVNSRHSLLTFSDPHKKAK